MNVKAFLTDVMKRGEEVFVRTVLPVENLENFDLPSILVKSYTVEELCCVLREGKYVYVNFTSSVTHGKAQTIMGSSYVMEAQRVPGAFLSGAGTIGYLLWQEADEVKVCPALLEEDHIQPLSSAGVFAEEMSHYLKSFQVAEKRYA
ncbi:hypothetical protein MUG87_19345 [Ectobacillus sp. JY-23]|uniref:hypothetical protein n=1 Tax=Ectobacillus sp. JY-23 TaxID=2933872 RepID=UPI001FF6A1AF|nr:hypothetical protein [Ectobacillus sp. JY-23]UOY92538.1 hypothetical protein MUG87_19345 [Ectobacillus sp. JY-23]